MRTFLTVTALIGLSGCAGQSDAPRSGYATIECQVTPSDDVSMCRVIEESPEGSGFGEAAIRLAQQGRVERAGPRSDDETFRATVRFAR